MDGRSLKVILELVNNLSGPMRAAVSDAQRSLSGFQSSVRGATDSATRAMGDYAQTTGKVISGDLGNILRGGVGLFGSFFDGVKSGLSSLVGAVGRGASAIIGSFGNIYNESSIGLAALSAALIKVGSDTLSLASKFERFSVATKYLTGSTEEANKFAKSVRLLSTETIFGIDQIAELETRLIGNTRSVAGSEKALRALLDAVAATGGGYVEAQSAVRAWIQTNSKAIASSEELNRQFSNANIPVVRSLAEAIVKDLNHPLRQYIDTATVTSGGGAVGASKKMTTAFQNASEQLPVLAKRSEAAELRLKQLADAGKQNTPAFKNAEASVLSYHQKLDKAQGSIKDFTAAQAGAGKATVSTAKLTVEGVMSQLQSLGELKIPGQLMAESITDALNKSFGGANKALMNSFSGQMELLGDQIKLTTLAFIGLDENFNAQPGGIFAGITAGVRDLNGFLLNNQKLFQEWGRMVGDSIPIKVGIITAAIVLFGSQLLKWVIIPLIRSIGPWFLLGAAIGFLADKFGLFDNMGQKMDWIRGKLSPLADFFQEKFVRIGQIFDELRERLAAKFFPDDFAEAKGSWNGFMRVLVDSMGPTFDRIKQKIQEFKNVFVFGEAKPPIDASWINVFEKFRGVVETVGGVLRDIFKPTWDALVASFETNKEAFAILAQTFNDSLPALQAFGQIVGTVVVVALLLLGGILTGLIRAFATVIGTITMFVTGAIQIFMGFFNIIMGLFTRNDEMIMNGARMLVAGLINAYNGLKGTVLGIIEGLVKGFVDFFQGLYNKLVGHSIVPDMVNGIIKWFGTLKEKAIEAVSGLASGVKDKFMGLVNQASAWGRGIIDNVVQGIRDAARALGGVGMKVLEKAGFGDLIRRQHGGMIPGKMGEAVPIIAHAGERVIPRSGVEEGGFEKPAININISGSFTLDDPQRINQLAQQIGRVLGRQQELAQYGAGY